MNKLVQLPDLVNGHTCFINPKEVVAVTEGSVRVNIRGEQIDKPQTVVYTTSGGGFKMDGVTATQIIRKLGL